VPAGKTSIQDEEKERLFKRKIKRRIKRRRSLKRKRLMLTTRLVVMWKWEKFHLEHCILWQQCPQEVSHYHLKMYSDAVHSVVSCSI
jgi:hypothetical protein